MEFLYWKEEQWGEVQDLQKGLAVQGGNTVGLSRHWKASIVKQEGMGRVMGRGGGLNSSKSMPPSKRRKENFFKNHRGEDVAASKSSTSPL